MTMVPAGQPLRLDPEHYPDAVLVAASLAEAGWPVVPLRHGSRVPLFAGGPGHEGARLRSAQEVVAVAEQYGGEDGPGRWPGFGVLTGEAGLDGWSLVVIDVDGPDGETALDELLGGIDGGRAWARSTYVVQTARGRHLYGVTRREAPPSTTGKLATHLDVRGASGGSYVVAAGSLHPSGQHYRDATDHDRNGPAATRFAPDAPEVFARLVTEPQLAVRWSRPLPLPEGLVEALTPAGSHAPKAHDAPPQTTPPADADDTSALLGEVVSDPAAFADSAVRRALAKVGKAQEGERRSSVLAAATSLARVRAGLVAAGADASQLGPLADDQRARSSLLEAAARDRPDGSPGMADATHRREAERALRDGWSHGSSRPDRYALAGSLLDGLSVELVDEPAEAASPAREPDDAPAAGTSDGASEAVEVVDEPAPRPPSPWGTGHRLDQAPPEPPSRPELGRRSDGVPMLAPRTTSIVHARKKAGKTFLALAWTADVASTGRGVLWIDWEDGVADLHERLVAMGLDDEARRHVTVLRPGSARLGAVGDRYGPGTPNAHDAALDELLATERPALVVVNSLGRLLGRHGLNPNAADDTERVEPLLTETLTATGAAVVVIDHQGNATTDRSAGSHRKGALVTGAELSVERVQRMGRGLRGWATIRLVDERNGHLAHLTRGDEVLARLLVDATAPDGSLTVSLDPPQGTPAASLDEHELTLDADAVLGDDDARAVLRVLAAHPDGLTTTRLRQEVGVANGGEPLRRHSRAVAGLVAARSVLVSPGARGSKVHRLAPDVEVPAEPDRDTEDGEVRP